VPPSSLTITVIVAVPLASAAGVYDSEPVASGPVYETVGSGIRPGLLDVAVTVSVCDSPAPGAMPVRPTVCGPGVLQDGHRADRVERRRVVDRRDRHGEGARDRVDAAVGRAAVSRTVTVMTAVPDRLDTGV
jgi:hypothetical protein